MPAKTMSQGSKVVVLAMVAGLAAGSTAMGQTRKAEPARSRQLEAMPIVLGQVPTLRTGPGGRPSRHPGGAADACNIVASHTDANFAGGTFVAQAGFAETEQAAATYTLTAADFPIRVNLSEFIVATNNATVSTTTKWTVSYYSGTPTSGMLVASYSSDDVLLPHIQLGPGTNGVNLQFSIDPQDPEQIIIQDDGSHTFTVAFRIDDHNQQTQNPCLIGPPTCCNAFPCTDVSGLAQPTRNWLFGLNCGAFGCPPNGGWASFASLPGACRPSGDWVQKTTWSSLNCTPGIGSCCLPSGMCQILTTTECANQGGTYRGDGTDCSTPCPLPTGACCLNNGTFCLNLTETNCTGASGVWQGGGSQCGAGNTCPTGACCLPSGACITGVTSAQCAAQSGTFRGAGSNCSSQCPQPIGACCFTSGFCIATLTQTECTGAGGVWQGALTTCGVGQCTSPCYANCDASTASPILNVNDFICFNNRFAAGDSYANCDASTLSPVLNVNDFTCFLNKYAAGCP